MNPIRGYRRGRGPICFALFLKKLGCCCVWHLEVYYYCPANTKHEAPQKAVGN